MMPHIWVYYEEDWIDGGLVPIKLNLDFGAGNFRWDKTYFYCPLEAPFERRSAASGFDDDTMSMTITQGDLVRHPDKPGYFGIYIPSLVERTEKQMRQYLTELHKEYGEIEIMHVNYHRVDQFIIDMADLEEVMQMDIKRIFEWR